MGSTCNWRDDAVCQFPKLWTRLFKFDGRRYCILHLPLEFSLENRPAEVVNAIRTESERTGNFDGVCFPVASYDFHQQEKLSFNHAQFADGVEMLLNGWTVVLATFQDCQFKGSARLRFADLRTLQLTNCIVPGALHIHANPLYGIDLSNCTLRGEFTVHADSIREHCWIHNCVFHQAPNFLEVQHLPQRTVFDAHIARKSIRAGDEGLYRHIRNLFNAIRAREEEGRFYALEKRCHRRRLGWGPAGWSFRAIVGRAATVSARGFSALYDWLSAYGQSYERAILWFVGLQVFAAFAYSIGSGRFDLGGEVDAQVVAFTLGQIAKPFELLGGRDPTSWTYGMGTLQTEPGLGWVLGTAAHSLVSFVLIALIILALRWRFRRE